MIFMEKTKISQSPSQAKVRCQELLGTASVQTCIVKVQPFGKMSNIITNSTVQ